MLQRTQPTSDNNNVSVNVIVYVPWKSNVRLKSTIKDRLVDI